MTVVNSSEDRSGKEFRYSVWVSITQTHQRIHFVDSFPSARFCIGSDHRIISSVSG